MEKKGKAKSRTHFVDICKVWPNCLQASMIAEEGPGIIPLLKNKEYLRFRLLEMKKQHFLQSLSDYDLHVALISERLIQNEIPTYCFGREFSSALREAKGSWLDSDIIKEEDFCAQVLIPEELGIILEREDGYKAPMNGFIVWVSGISDENKGIRLNAVGKDVNMTFLSRTENGKIDWGREGAHELDNLQKEVVDFSLRCIAYIRSADPDLHHLKPDIPKYASSRKLERLKAANPNLFRVTWVSWDWKRPRVFGVDETCVTGHLRWQPCGPDLKQRKLIWINEHVRHFNKEQTLGPTATPQEV